ncbi:G-patch-domain-containing protein [Lindgomyces ingoldianus]|uniref:G-patch-domain-containing protein n=1 Tax=Lindgomyces ingoldianus TaxID=673940 RepID=A0ACB6QPY6_9PLEO|nr:G-patch-domain-containing protein [Lindgomyces ingoldianus]KAF2468216.1 G-patch-domain-containing protein [Lindgomyces ingoldianus]
MSQSEEEDDYMSMVFDDAPKAGKETSLQRRARMQKEGEAKARAKTRAEKEAETEAAREAGLATALDSSSKGFKMMAKFGFRQGDTLGKAEDARKEPIHLSMKDDRSGLGLESERKRKLRELVEEAEKEVKRSKIEQVDYRERVRQENEEKRLGVELYNAQKTAERLVEEDDQSAREGQEWTPTSEYKSRQTISGKRSLQSINILWRRLVRNRLEKERDRKRRQHFNDSLSSTLPTYISADEDEDADDKLALGHDVTAIEDDLEDLSDEDLELEEFEAQPLAERLQKVVVYLREAHHYCFWCKYRYSSATLDGCPGITEKDHD